MTTFYEFQAQFPDDEACLERIMKARHGGTELDCTEVRRVFSSSIA